MSAHLLPFRAALLAAAGLLPPACAPAPPPEPAPEAALAWQPSWPGTELAVLRGDPAARGPFAFRFRMPDGYWTGPHHHPVAAHIRVIAGTYLVGHGTALDPAASRAFEPGSELLLEAGSVHFDGARGETVIEVQGEGPWGVTFLDPGGDPARR